MRFSLIAEELIEGVCPFCRGRKYLRGGYECPKCKATGTDSQPEAEVAPRKTTTEIIEVMRKHRMVCISANSVGTGSFGYDRWKGRVLIDVYGDSSWGDVDDQSGPRYGKTGVGPDQLDRYLSSI